MSVRAAVEKVDQVAPPEAPKPVSVATVVRQAIEQQSDAFRQVLPSHVDPERFGRLVLTAVKAAPDLMRCFETPQGKTSVLLSAMQAAAIGLEPNTPTQECWLLPRKRKNVWECNLYVGYRGYLKLTRRSATTKTVVADVVREKDHFRWERGLEADVLEHRPYEGEGEAGELTHAYAIVRYTNGGYNYVVLNRRAIEERREMSDSWKNPKSRPYSPWTKWTAAQWRKSAIRALVPFLDLTPEGEAAVHSDERSLSMDDSGVIDVEEQFGELGMGDDGTAEDGIDVPEESAGGEPEGPLEGELVYAPGEEPFE